MDSLTVWACYLKKEGATLHLHNWHIFPSGLWQRAGPSHNEYARGGRGWRQRGATPGTEEEDFILRFWAELDASTSWEFGFSQKLRQVCNIRV